MQVVLSNADANSTAFYGDRKNEDLVICVEYKCNYFTPNGLCFYCMDPRRKEYCFLTYSACRATCDLCKPNC